MATGYCTICSKPVERKPSELAKQADVYCSKECTKIAKTKRITLSCGFCNIEFEKSYSQYLKTDNHYCSKSCAIKRNNANPLVNRRKLEGSCLDCQTVISSSRKYCKICFTNRFLVNIDNLTKLEMYQKQNYHQKIRSDSRNKKLQLDSDIQCLICGYTNFVEVAHIKPVASFSDNTLMSEINSISNLIYLCPNHHKEFDRGLLDINI